MSEPFNPLHVSSLAASIVSQIMALEPAPLGEVERFGGAGIYAVYARSSHPAYKLLSAANEQALEHPIYVGKAEARGSRTGIGDATSGTPLWSRINEHAKSIRASTSLDIDEFWVRWLVVESIWIPLGESTIIASYKPVWNALLSGFGNHAPGSGRNAGKLSRWDNLHGGRFNNSIFGAPAETPAQLQQEIQEYLRSRLQ